MELTLKKAKRNNSFFSYFKRNYDLYLLLIPALVYVFVFNILPMLGIYLAFIDYNIFAGKNPIDAIFQSKFAGLDNFTNIMSRPDFIVALKNTLIISLQKIVFLFPLPIILALMLNSIGNRWFKKISQTVLYMPHFISWVVVSGMFTSVLGMRGPVNQFISSLGLNEIKFFMDADIFRGVVVFTAGWKELGWSSIIYLAALMAIDQEQYEAAEMDGASGFRKLIYITIPGIYSTIALMLIIRIGGIMDAGFGQILVMYNPTVYKTADIIQTFVYRIGIGQIQFSTGAAVGLFNSLIAFLLIIGANALCRKFLDRSIW